MGVMNRMHSLFGRQEEEKPAQAAEEVTQTAGSMVPAKEIQKAIGNIRKAKTSGEHYLPWSDVATVMLETPEKLAYTGSKCECCGADSMQMYFRSPDWTWEQMCGRAGQLVICPRCPRQIDFLCRAMN